MIHAFNQKTFCISFNMDKLSINWENSQYAPRFCKSVSEKVPVFVAYLLAANSFIKVALSTLV